MLQVLFHKSSLLLTWVPVYSAFKHYKLAYETAVNISTYIQTKSYVNLKKCAANINDIYISTITGIKSVRFTNIHAKGLNAWSWKSGECGTWCGPIKQTALQNWGIKEQFCQNSRRKSEILAVPRFLNQWHNKVGSLPQTCCTTCKELYAKY